MALLMIVRALVRRTALLVTFACLVLGYPIAYFMARSKSRLAALCAALVVAPLFVSVVIRGFGWMVLLAREGVVNQALVAVGVFAERQQFLYTDPAVLIGLVHILSPFMILPIYGSAEKLDNSLIEAAHDLGAGPVRAFSSVIVPLTMPGIAAGTLLVFVPAIGMFAITDLMGGAKVPMIGNVIQNQFLQARDWPFGAALGVVFMLMFALTYVILQSRGARPTA